MFKNLCPETLGFSGRRKRNHRVGPVARFQGTGSGHLSISPSEVKDPGFRQGLAAARQRAAEVRQLSLPVRWQDDDCLSGRPEAACRAGRPGPAARLHAGHHAIEPASDERPYHENFEFHRRRLDELAAVLAEARNSPGPRFSGADRVPRKIGPFSSCRRPTNC